MSDEKRPSTPSIEEALRMLTGAAESVHLAAKDYGPQVLDALKKNSMKGVGAPSPESGAELVLRQIDKYVRELVYMVDEVHAHLGYKSAYTQLRS